ncbi:MAG: hypothetical protein IT379_01105 [Deltaproteobacteria bacterium]|nr:hypothetical protein [Deltaproteobacteria bacterium]
MTPQEQLAVLMTILVPAVAELLVYTNWPQALAAFVVLPVPGRRVALGEGLQRAMRRGLDPRVGYRDRAAAPLDVRRLPWPDAWSDEHMVVTPQPHAARALVSMRYRRLNSKLAVASIRARIEEREIVFDARFLPSGAFCGAIWACLLLVLGVALERQTLLWASAGVLTVVAAATWQTRAPVARACARALDRIAAHIAAAELDERPTRHGP